MTRAICYVVCMLAGLIIAATSVRAASAITEVPGLIIEEIVADLPAAKAGLKVGDKLLTFEEKPLSSLAALQAIQQNSFGKKEGVLRVQRGEESLTLSVPMGSLGMILRTDLPPSALPFYMKGKAAQRAEKQAEIISNWVMAAKEAEKVEAKAAASWLYWLAGAIYQGQENWKEAQEMYDAAWKLVDGSPDAAAQVRVMESLAWCSQNLKNYPASQKWCERALKVNTVAGYEIWAAGDLTSLGRIALDTRDFQAARGFFGRAHKIYERLTPNSKDVASSLALLGGVAYFSSDLDAARDYFQSAIKINEKLDPTSEDFARNLDSLGSVVYLRGDLDAAEEHYRRSLEIRRRIAPDGSLDVASSLNNLGNVAYFRGDLLAAQDYYRKALDIYKRIAPNSLEYAASVNNLGGVFYSANNLQAAHDYYDRALGIYQRLDPDSLNVAMGLNNLGNVAYFRNDLDAAQDYHRRALELRLRLAPGSLDAADSLDNMGSIAYLRGDLPAAEDYNRSALKIRDQLAPGSLKFAASLANLGKNAFKKSRFPEALQFFTDAVNIIEAQRGKISSIEARAFFTARYTYSYIGLLETNLALKNPAAAFAVVERARARSLIELLGERRLTFQTDVPPELAGLLGRQEELNQKRSTTYAALNDTFINLNGARSELRNIALGGEAQRIEKLNKQIKSFEKQMDELRIKLIEISVQQRELEAKIRRDPSRVTSLKYPEPLDLKGAQAALDADTLLLSYFIGIEETYLFAVTKKSIKVFTLPTGETTLKDQVRAFRSEVKNKRVDRSKLREQGRSLYDLLIGPAQESVNQAKRILICPDGPLTVLPFAALVRQSHPRLRYFIEDKPLHIINSMTVYAEMRKPATGNKQQQKRLLAFVNPVNNLTALPSALNEVKEVRRLFGQSATVKQGREATETTAKKESKDYSILHFAVHGLLNDEVGLNSSLALSQPEMMGGKATINDNGLLQAWEIFEQVRLKADLVVLSSCDTGSGENVRGEGLIGLTRAFQYAGAKSIVVSLWSVNDDSTARLMTAFYQELQKGVDKDIALQKAIVTVRNLQEWEHPSYWSPFILVGDWQ
jgi:CHAT domain-containing protein/tetratricopeptide (TPR) repeat protein